MSGDEWKPGDVALVRISDYPPEIAVSSDRQWFVAGPRLGSQYGWYHDRVEVIRPLVVLDPEDREQVARLADAFCEARWCHVRGGNTDECDPLTRSSMKEALVAYLAPPKPPEPTGLGAVVEDAEGVLWLRSAVTGEAAWRREGSIQPRLTWHMWRDVTAVRVLSEGVTP